MSKTVLTNVRLFVGPTDLTGVSNRVEITDTLEDKETTNFGSGGAKEYIAGLESVALSAEGQWQAGSTTTVDVDDEMWGDRRTVQAWSVAPVGTTEGNVAYLTQALRLDSKLFGAVGDVAPWTMSAAGSWPLARGMSAVSPGTAISSSGNGTAVELGAVSSTQRLYAAMHVLSVSGTSSPSIAVTIQSSDDDSFGSPTTQLTLTTASATGSQITRTDVGAITDTWYRAHYTVSGSTPSFLVFIALGIAI